MARFNFNETRSGVRITTPLYGKANLTAIMRIKAQVTMLTRSPRYQAPPGNALPGRLRLHVLIFARSIQA